MAGSEAASSILYTDVVRRSPESPQRQGDRAFPLGEGRHDERRGAQRGAIARSDLIDCDTVLHLPEFHSTEARLEADGKLLDFRLEQYLKYLRSVRAAGLEPNSLLCGLEVAESGPNAPPQDFWCLIVARDDLISQARELGTQIEARKETAKANLGMALVYSTICAAMVTFFPFSIAEDTLRAGKWIIVTKVAAGTLPWIFPAWKVCKIATARHCNGVLQFLVERAITWELGAEGRNILRQLVWWQWVLRH